MDLESNFGSQVVKWQRWQVDYLSEKSMLIVKFKIFYQDFIGFQVKKCLKTNEKWLCLRQSLATSAAYYKLIHK